MASSVPHTEPTAHKPHHPQVEFVDAYPDIPNTMSPSPITEGFAAADGSAEDSPRSPLHSKSKRPDAWDDIIPPSHRWRTIVLCFDGTGDQFDTDNSNIVQFFSMLKKDSKRDQLVYYQAGIGTYTVPQIATPLMARLNKTIDMMLGVHLDAHVMAGYEFLMQNYEEGDKICIFGFSRGSYTARALAGMVHKVGLLPVCNHQQVPFAYKMYTKDTEEGWQQSTAFKKAFSIDVDIEFLGVWDTVASVGLIPKRLPFTKSSASVKYFRHAISLDEHRSKFHPSFWHRSTEVDDKLGVQQGEMPKSRRKHSDHSLEHLERKYTAEWDAVTDVEEVWFAGCHCDVGGGSVPNGTRNALARIPLRWMIRQCFLASTGIMFHREMFKHIGLDVDMLWPDVKPRPPPLSLLVEGSSGHARHTSVGTSKTLVAPNHSSIGPAVVTDFISEEHEDLVDALCPMYDQLKLRRAWWILEVLPRTVHYQRGDDSWVRETGMNLGRGRPVPGQKRVGAKVHRTVKLRMEADGLEGGKYRPKAKLRPEVEPTWAD